MQKQQQQKQQHNNRSTNPSPPPARHSSPDNIKEASGEDNDKQHKQLTTWNVSSCRLFLCKYHWQNVLRGSAARCCCCHHTQPSKGPAGLVPFVSSLCMWVSHSHYQEEIKCSTERIYFTWYTHIYSKYSTIKRHHGSQKTTATYTSHRQTATRQLPSCYLLVLLMSVMS